jgi:hypothetical protein
VRYSDYLVSWPCRRAGDKPREEEQVTRFIYMWILTDSLPGCVYSSSNTHLLSQSLSVSHSPATIAGK